MAKNEAIAKAIAADPYLKKRKAPTEAEQQLYLKEVSFVCPLCGKILRHRRQGKANKLYEIAHIFPNSPTEEQYERLGKLTRLGDNSESFENKIALCKDCHDQQDYHTTQEDYLKLLNKKQRFLQLTDLHEATLTMGLELEIANVVERFCLLREDEIARLNYTPVRLTKKFAADDFRLKNRIGIPQLDSLRSIALPQLFPTPCGRDCDSCAPYCPRDHRLWFLYAAYVHPFSSS